MTYKWKPNSRIGINAETAGAVMDNLEQRGALTAKNLVDESRPAEAPLHGEFEWDDVKAAEEYRLQQARHIINCLLIEDDAQQETVRAFFNLAESAPEYRSIRTIMADETQSEALLQVALHELQAFERKYVQISKFRALFAEIDRLSE